ncbi:hypothetical protein GQ457_08G033840 [Hibiscus cannabinus]
MRGDFTLEETVGETTLEGLVLPELADMGTVFEPPTSEVAEASNFNGGEVSMGDGLPSGNGASNFQDAKMMRFRENDGELKEVHLEHTCSVFQFNLPNLLGVGCRTPNPADVRTAKTWHGPKPTSRFLRRKPELPTNLRVRSVFNVMVSKFSHKDRDNPDRGRLKLVGKSSYDRDVLEKRTGNVTWQCEPRRAVLIGGQSSQSLVLFMGRAVLLIRFPHGSLPRDSVYLYTKTLGRESCRFDQHREKAQLPASLGLPY